MSIWIAGWLAISLVLVEPRMTAAVDIIRIAIIIQGRKRSHIKIKKKFGQQLNNTGHQLRTYCIDRDFRLPPLSWARFYPVIFLSMKHVNDYIEPRRS